MGVAVSWLGVGGSDKRGKHLQHYKAAAEVPTTVLLYPPDCFYLLAIVHSAAMGIDEQVSLGNLQPGTNWKH